ncbi:MAG: hypothetical protein KBA03_03630 [Anaerolineaceae bacterium]|nr:hypothetical protein [Anaerolineaceae bacterium]
MSEVEFESPEERDRFIKEHFRGEESQRIAGDILDGKYLSMEDRKQRDVEVVSAILQALRWWYPQDVINKAALQIGGFVGLNPSGLDNKNYPKQRGNFQD